MKKRKHTLSMKGTIYLEKIEQGLKKYEGRIYGSKCRKMSVNDDLILFDHQAGWGILCRITSLDIFASFEEMLKSKGVLNMLPQLADGASKVQPSELLEEGIKIYKQFPGSSREADEGVVAIGVQYVSRCSYFPKEENSPKII